MHARVSQAAPVGDASIPAASTTGAFIAAFCQPLSGGVMIGGGGEPHDEHFGESCMPKYGRFPVIPENV